MKAHKQFTFHKEHSLVWSYSATILLLGLVIMLRPVVAQQNDNLPDVKVEVKKEYDEGGKLVNMDSVKTWCWSGNAFTREEFDSLWKDIGMDLHALFPRNFDPFSFPGITTGPPMHNFWHWNGEDSTAYSYLEELFDEETLKEFRERYHSPGSFGHWPAPDLDSLALSFRENKWLNDAFRQDFREHYNDLQDRLENYHREHQMLIEKYFSKPEHEEKKSPEAEPNSYVPASKEEQKNKSGKI